MRVRIENFIRIYSDVKKSFESLSHFLSQKFSTSTYSATCDFTKKCLTQKNSKYFFLNFRDVQCLSCDKNVVMRVEESNPIRAPPMPYMKSIKPYLTYELDQIRKQQKKLPQRNMLQFEAALQEERKIKAKEEPLVKTPRYKKFRFDQMN